MNILKKKTILNYIVTYPTASSGLKEWLDRMKKHNISSIIELKKMYPSADNIKGTDYICIDINGNNFRLIARYRWGKTIFVIEFLTHVEYTKKYCKGKMK